jgi:hypothetical protein
MKTDTYLDSEEFLLALDPAQISDSDSAHLTALFGSLAEALAYREFLLATTELLDPETAAAPSPHIQEELREKVRHRKIFANGFSLSPLLYRFGFLLKWQYTLATVVILGCILSFHTSPAPGKNKMLYADTATVKPRNADTTASMQEQSPPVVQMSIANSVSNSGHSFFQEAIRTEWFSGDAPYEQHNHRVENPGCAPHHPETGQYAVGLLHPHTA